MEFRKAAKEDAECIAKLFIKLHKEMTLEEALKEVKYFLSKDVFYLALDEGRAVGYIFGRIRRDYVEGSEQAFDPKVGYIESLYVLPAFRKQGIARQLIKMLEDWARSEGCHEFASDAYASNRSSIKFHKAVGFECSKPIIGFIKKI